MKEGRKEGKKKEGKKKWAEFRSDFQWASTGFLFFQGEGVRCGLVMERKKRKGILVLEGRVK